jgi:hypothetical protein
MKTAPRIKTVLVDFAAVTFASPAFAADHIKKFLTPFLLDVACGNNDTAIYVGVGEAF